MSTDRTIVALGCSPDADYAFNVPLTALLWRRVGFEPLVIVVGRNRAPDGTKNGGALEWSQDPSAKVAFEALRHHKIPTYSVAAVDGYPYATTAQNCRQHAAAIAEVSDFGNEIECLLKISEDDWIMPADSDLYPLRPSFYQSHVGSSHRMISYYWNGDHLLSKAAFLKAVSEGRRSQTIPTCHVVMRARDWRQVYGLTPGERVEFAVQRTLDAWFQRFPRDDFNVWMSDQDIMTAKLCEQPWFPSGTPPHDSPHSHVSGEVLFVPRLGHPPLDRLCRSVNERWGGQFDPERWTDAHVFKNPTQLEYWVKLLEIIRAVIPEHAAWAASYHKAYVEASRG